MVALAVLAIAKFVLVVGYYMHLKFDARLLTWLFVGGLVTAVAMISGLWALFNGWGG
jgi:cytochrome c oxidase subunit 4